MALAAAVHTSAHPKEHPLPSLGAEPNRPGDVGEEC